MINQFYKASNFEGVNSYKSKLWNQMIERAILTEKEVYNPTIVSQSTFISKRDFFRFIYVTVPNYGTFPQSAEQA